MKIYRPVKTNWLYQGFGEDRACFDPVTKKVTGRHADVCPLPSVSLYDYVGLTGHPGEDWMIYSKEPVYHSADFIGTAKTEIDAMGGIGVDVISKERIDGEYVKMRYWHLDHATVFDGQEIKPGDKIGEGDSTGLSGGDHLHWAKKPCDEKGNPIYPNNGFQGARDFRPDFVNLFILDALNIKQQITLLQKVLELLMRLKISTKK